MSKPVRIFSRYAVEPVAGDELSVAAIFSDDSVARDRDVWVTAGMDCTGFKTNPVVPYAHNIDAPPVGRVTTLIQSQYQLRGIVTFTPADISPFGAMIGKMYRGGYLNAFSVSVIPLEWRYSTDPKRQGGRDFTRSDVLEISAVAVPALTSALVTARNRGFDISPAARWAEHKLEMLPVSETRVAQLCAIRKAAIAPPIYHLLERAPR